jgi:nucleoside-diphosphate-sugar epimerase
VQVVITGAAGAIGSQLAEELSPAHELRLIDIRPVPGRKTIIGDLSHRTSARGGRKWFRSSSSWRDAFNGANVVVHLAANSESLAPWAKVLPANIQATWNVLEAAAKHGVPRVVFASSNWAVKSLEQKLAPACYLPDGPKIDSLAPPCSINAYGLSKGFGELTGRMFVDEGRLRSFVAVRIGNYNPTPSDDDVVRTRWLGTEDMRGLLRRCVEAEFNGFHVVYGVSAQPSSPYDLSHTSQLLHWQPRQTLP